MNWFPKQQLRYFIFTLGFVCAVAHADPENFMVGQLTFVRPKKWEWVWDEKLANDGMLLSVHSTDASESAGVFFRAFHGTEGSPDERIRVWRKYFRESSNQLNVHTESRTIASLSVVYIEMEGTALRGASASGPFSLVAAVISTSEGRVVARMSGRKSAIESAKPMFNEMVEQALKDREAESMAGTAH